MERLGDLSDVRYGHSLELNRLARTSPESGIPFVSRKTGDNGIAAYVRQVPGGTPDPAGELTCALSGNGVLTTRIHERAYYTAFHVACLRPKVELSIAQMLYYCACIRANRHRYSWGRPANRSLRGILRPEPAEMPEWVAEVADFGYSGRAAPASSAPPPPLDPSTWATVRLSELFDIKKGRRLAKADSTPGRTPLVSAIDGSNGLTRFIDATPLHPANTITVNYSGNGVAAAFDQPAPYWCSDDVNVLYPRFDMSPAVALFIAAVIRLEKYRFSYGRKWHVGRMARPVIRLPMRPDGKPDRRALERYIRAMPYGSQI